MLQRIHNAMVAVRAWYARTITERMKHELRVLDAVYQHELETLKLIHEHEREAVRQELTRKREVLRARVRQTEAYLAALEHKALHVAEQSFDTVKLETVKLFRDGDHFCAMIGDDLMEGLAGFGKTEAHALHELADAVEREANNILPTEH